MEEQSDPPLESWAEDVDASVDDDDETNVGESPQAAGDASGESEQSASPDCPDAAPAGFDIDDRLGAHKATTYSDGLTIDVSFRALIDWTAGTGVRVQVVSTTSRSGGDGSKRYNLLTTFVIVFTTGKLGQTNPPMETFPMEDDWPNWGLNLIGSNLKYGQYRPGSPYAAVANIVSLPFSGAHIIQAKGEPRDNKIHRVTIQAYGGPTLDKKWYTPQKSAIRGGS